MFRKSFAFILSIALSCIVISAQDAPKPEKTEKALKDRLERVYSLSFGGSNGYLGIYMSEVNNENFAKYGLNSTRGVAVNKVIKDSPAEKAGIQKGDVIVSFNGEAITSMRKLRRLISEVAPDHKFSMTIVRKGNEQEINATMGKRKSVTFANSGGSIRALPIPRIEDFPISPDMPGKIRVPFPKGKLGKTMIWTSSSRTMGVTVTTLTDQLRDFFGVEKGEGLLIKSVKADSPAAKAGLKAGDVITKIDGKSVSNTFDISRALSAKKEGQVDLTFVRNKRSETVKITPEKREPSPSTEFEFFGTENE